METFDKLSMSLFPFVFKMFKVEVGHVISGRGGAKKKGVEI